MPLAWVLEVFAPLLKKRDTWYLILIVLLALAFDHARKRADAAEAIIATRPSIHTEAEQKTQIVRVSGPVRYETKTVYVPGTTQIQYVDRVVMRDPVTTTTEKETEVKRDVAPACPPPYRPKTRFAGLIFGGDGYQGSWVKGARGGIDVFDRLDLGVNLVREKQGATVLGGDVSFRW
jgi:hypothetical protein